MCYTDNLTLSNHSLTNAENHEPSFEEVFAIYSIRTTQDVSCLFFLLKKF